MEQLGFAGKMQAIDKPRLVSKGNKSKKKK
jgi:hypothetical protein